MKFKNKIKLGLLVNLLCILYPSYSNEISTEEMRTIEAHIETNLTNWKIPGLSIAIIDGKEIINKNTSDNEKEMIEDFKDTLNDLTGEELLGFIYFTFPEMIKESIKIQKIKPNRKNIALRLYAKSKISFGKALEIAGINIDDFIKEAKSKGIQIYR